MTDIYRPAWVHDRDIELTQGEEFDWPFQARNEDGDIIDTSAYTATLTVRSPDANGTVQLTATDTGGDIVLGYTPAPVERNTAYGVGQQVVPIALNGYVYECTVAGTTHATNEPTWPTTIGQTVADGTVTWRCEALDTDVVANVYVVIPAATTAALTAWGRGVYSLTVRNEFDQSWLFVDGAAYLRESSIE